MARDRDTSIMLEALILAGLLVASNGSVVPDLSPAIQGFLAAGNQNENVG
jgi:hypothetical protein